MNLNIPVLVLCGGQGQLLYPGQGRLNKALAKVNGESLVRHTVRHYMKYGFSHFHFLTGFQSEQVEADLVEKPIEGATLHFEFTGTETATGSRVAMVRDRIGSAEIFAVTYSDALSDVNLAEELSDFKSKNVIGCLAGVRLPTRFEVLGLRPGETKVRAFAKDLVISQEFVNGGYYFFRREFLSERYLPTGDAQVTLEQEPLRALAEQNQLEAYIHKGQWHPLDSERDLTLLEKMRL